MNVKNSIFIKKWKKINYKMIKTSYPDVPKKEIMAFLDKEIETHLSNPECYIDNNYLKKKIKSTLLDIYDWITKTKPICGGHGVFFRNQHQVKSTLAQMILKFLSLRKSYKGRLKDFNPESYEYATYDRKQLSEKQNANSIYGSFGNATSFIFNKYTAPSVTGTGQSLISTTCMAFESFMSNNVAFNNLNECMMYLYNISNDDYDTDILPDIPLNKVEEHIIDMFYRYEDRYYEPVHNYLQSIPQSALNKIYYKNNLYEFTALEKPHNTLTKIMRECKEFINPNKVPENVDGYMKELWSLYKTYVFYNHSPVDRIQRLKNDKRKCVVTIDTDSNMLNLHPWVEYVFENVVTDDMYDGRDKDTIKFIAINTMAYVITAMMVDVLYRYTDDAHVPEDFRSYINIKNEFLFTRMILSSKKKRYMSSVKLREGEIFSPEKIDIKGLDFMKSTTSETVKKAYMNMITNRVLHAENIDLGGLLKDVAEFEDIINASLHRGEKEFLSPLSVKELEAYADPYRGQGIRAVHAWNVIYPEMTIELPAKIDIVKVIDSPENMERLKDSNPEIYERIMSGIINCSNEKISKKGFCVLAIPKNVKKVPDWIIPMIDYETISYNVLKKVFPILESLGFKTLKTSKMEYFSNIIDV